VNHAKRLLEIAQTRSAYIVLLTRHPDYVSGTKIVTIHDEILTVAEVATELRCSKAHVHNAINGKLERIFRLPAIHMGRRRLVRRSALERWKMANEKGSLDPMMPSPEVDAVRPMKGDFHAS
jgi:excisionase family DNA binding protein